MSEKKIDPQYLPLVTAAREQREKVLAEIEAAHKKPERELRKRLALLEDVLSQYDPNFTPAPGRLSHLQPLQAAILILAEGNDRPMPRQELISQMISGGCAFGHSNPKRSILSAFGQRRVRKILLFDEATDMVSLSGKAHEILARHGGKSARRVAAKWSGKQPPPK